MIFNEPYQKAKTVIYYEVSCVELSSSNLLHNSDLVTMTRILPHSCRTIFAASVSVTRLHFLQNDTTDNDENWIRGNPNAVADSING